MDYQILVVLIFVAMSIADAVSRRRKRQQRTEEMERAEREDRAQGQREPSGPRAGAEEWEWEGSGTDPRGEAPHGAQRAGRGVGSGGADGEGPRETADTLVPDDLWAILTGQTPQQRQPPPAPRAPAPSSEGGQSRAEREFEELTTQPWRAGPDGEETASSRPPTTPTPVPPSRPKQAPRPATGSAGRPVPGQRTGRKPLPTREQMPAPSTRFPTPARSRGQLARKAPHRSEVPWKDISAGEIGSEGGSFYSSLRREVGAPAIIERRGSGASAYVRDLRSAGREGLRRAIVLQEVLGPPVSLRPAEKRVWEAWDD